MVIERTMFCSKVQKAIQDRHIISTLKSFVEMTQGVRIEHHSHMRTPAKISTNFSTNSKTFSALVYIVSEGENKCHNMQMSHIWISIIVGSPWTTDTK